MSRFGQFLLLVLAMAAAVIAGDAVLKITQDARQVEALRREFAEYKTEQSIEATKRASELVDDQAQQGRRNQHLQDALDELNKQVTGLLLRKPPKAVEFDWSYRFNRVEQRIGQLESARWGQK